MKDKIREITDLILEDIIAIRRHLHANPELSFKEFETSKFIKSKLDDWNITYTDNWVKTGIIAEITGKPAGKTIAARADMDALPIKENSGVAYSSKNDGVMHACGHDFHTASLLGVIHVLNQIKDGISGTIKFIFQPGEELLPGGAKLMMEEGALEGIEKIYGLHVFPDLEAGKVGFKPGLYMASADELHVKVTGKGGHAALPHKFIDPIYASALLINGLQQIVSRNAKPDIPTVLSFGHIQGLGATNVIPTEVELRGTFRTFNEAWRSEAHQKMLDIKEGIEKSCGVSIDFDIKKGYPFLTNDVNTTNKSIDIASDYLSKENVEMLDLRMTAEDFAYYTQEIPGCFFRIGTSNKEKQIGGSLHHPELTIDDEALKIAVGVMSYLLYSELADI